MSSISEPEKDELIYNAIEKQLITVTTSELSEQFELINKSILSSIENANEDVKLKHGLKDLLASLAKSKELVSKINKILSSPVLAKINIKLKDLLEEATRIFSQEKGINFIKKYPNNLPVVELDKNLFMEALLDIAVAYAHALPTDSPIVLETEIDEKTKRIFIKFKSNEQLLASPFEESNKEISTKFDFASKVIEAHHGTIEFDGTIEKDFTVKIAINYIPIPTKILADKIQLTVLFIKNRDDSMADSICSFLRSRGYVINSVDELKFALKVLSEETFDVFLIDEKIFEQEKTDIISEIHNIDSTIPIIVLGGYELTETVSKVLNKGVVNYLKRPFNKEELMSLLKDASEKRKLKQEVETLRSQLGISQQFGIVLGESPAITKILELIKQVAPTEMTVVLQGESGSGKEVIARLIHRYSNRANKPFIAIDCGAIPESLVESELFGYEKGAFTGADRRKLGQFELASAGTLFLDEIGNLPIHIQIKLLRVLQERKIQHLGGKSEVDVDVRIIAATNIDLSQAVASNKFREDLYHRLNEFFINLPPLRERTADILPLAESFREEANKELSKKVKGFNQEVIMTLNEYHWPGNIRELKNTIKRAVLLANDIILPQHIEISLRKREVLNKPLHQESTSFKQASVSDLKKTGKEAAAQVEKQMILDALEKTKYNKTEAAKILGIDRTSLYYKLKKFGL